MPLSPSRRAAIIFPKSSLRMHGVRKRWALQSYQGWVLSGASAIHATSEMEADNLRRLGLRGVPLFVVPNTVTEPAHTPSQSDFQSAAHGQDRVLLFLSRIHPKKGLDLLLAAWNELRPRNWRLMIVGSGEPHYVASLLGYCKDHDLPNVEFQPHTEAHAREALFQRASAFILPTYSENFGNVVAEALIRGLPVVTTTGTPWSQIREQGCGWYVAPDLDGLKGALRAVTTSDATTLAAMGEKGRRYAIRHFTTPAVRDPLLHMYHSAIH